MILTRTTKWYGEKMTIGELIERYHGVLHKVYKQFYDPRDRTLNWISKEGVSSVDWLYQQRKNEVIYLLENTSDKLKAREEKV